MKFPIPATELAARIELNRNRLATGECYQIPRAFSAKEYEWFGDREGRVILAFMSHYKINGEIIPTLKQVMELMPGYLNEKGFFGPTFEGKIHEQQLSGHSWLLRGLCEYYEQFGEESVLASICAITENLFLTKKGGFSDYPVDREQMDVGDVCGDVMGNLGKWILSSDVGCAFMAIDGLSHAYRVLKDEKVAELVHEMCEVYLGIDKVALRVQTHCTLSAARGMIRMYHLTEDKFYLEGAQSILDLYANGGGMTRTYQNLNWWGRPNTWTEPCAIVDSLMVATELYKITGREEYRELAARVYHNGFASAQRANGGAGTDSVVAPGGEDTLFMTGYEADFCCTMRFAEGLWYIHENADLLYAQTTGEVVKNDGVYMDGDIVYALPSDELAPYVEKTVEADGLKLSPLVKYYKLPDEVAKRARQKIVF